MCVFVRFNPSPYPSPEGRGNANTLSLRERAGVRENVLLLRVKRLFHPAVKLLLVGFDPTVHVAFHIRF